MWSVSVKEGFATGPAEELTDKGVTVKVSTVWTDEDGVCVSIDSGDEPIPASLIGQLGEVMKRLAATAAPCLAFAGMVVAAFSQAGQVLPTI